MIRPRIFSRPTSRRLALGLCIALACLLSCATQPAAEAVSPPGFLMGFVHGLIMPFSLLGSLFKDVRIYAFPNSGVWYDVGYFLGASALLGGGGAKARG